MDVSSLPPRQTKAIFLITKATWGGAQQYVFDLLQEAVHDHLYDTVGLAYGEAGLLSKKVAELSIPVHELSALARDISPMQDIRAFVQMYRLFKKDWVDVAHLNSSKAGAIGALAARMAGVRRIVFTAHGWAFNEKRSYFSRLFFIFIHYVTILLSDVTIVVSQGLADQAAHWPFVKGKIHVIHLGIGPQDYLDRDNARDALIALDPTLTSTRTARWIGTIAELHPNKGIDIGIEAMRKIEDKDIPWIILGGGERKDEYTREKPINTHFLGFVPNAARYLKAFDLFLLPSRTEAFGYVLLEAGSAGIPVLASNVGGIPEIITSDQLGVLFPVGDTAELTKQIDAFASAGTEWEEKGTNLRESVQKRFSLEKMCKETFALYSR
jgi:glycosyltransferase involved in cell wall biosynthesis